MTARQRRAEDAGLESIGAGHVVLDALTLERPVVHRRRRVGSAIRSKFMSVATCR